MSEQLPPFLCATPADLAKAAALLRAGEVVAMPTETVYGLAAHALDEAAVRKIFEIKGRPLLDPLIIHGADAETLASLAHFTPAARKLAESFWPGPLTLVLRKDSSVSDLVTAGLPTVAVRVPAHPVAQALLRTCNLPLAAPSANPFGYISPTRAEHVRASLGARAPWILDGGPCAHGIESTIVDVSDPAAAPRLLRPGPVTPEMLSAALGAPVEIRPRSEDTDATAALPAPGLLPHHYSPRTPLSLLATGVPPAPRPGERTAWIRLGREPRVETSSAIDEFYLSESGDLAEAARALYDLLRRLDAAGYSAIGCETPPEDGLGIALNDRLGRAANQT